MKYFNWSELFHSNYAVQNGINNCATDYAIIRNIELLVNNVLDPARHELGEPIFVNSCYRCETVNRAVGGAVNSLHLIGRAADIRTTSKEKLFELYSILQNLPHVELKNYKTFIHVAL